MMTPLIAKLAIRDDLSPHEQDRIVTLPSRTRSFAPGEEIVREEVPVDFSCVVLDGLCCRQKVLGDGRRQIMAFHVAGDFCDLHNFLLHRMEHTVVALSPCEIAMVPHERLTEITVSEPHLARLLWVSTLIDAAMHREWIISMGRRSTFGRLAHLFCEMFVRLRAIGQAKGFEYSLPVTQTDLSDAMGISLVHTNRTLSTLRQQDLVSFSNRTVSIHNWERLQRVAEFDPGYLHLDREPR